MADNVTILDANDAEVPVAADDVSSVWYQYVKLDLGAGGASAPASGTVPVSDGAGSLTVDNGGTFAVQAVRAGTAAAPRRPAAFEYAQVGRPLVV